MECNENSDDIRKKESEPLEHMIPGYEIFDNYMQVNFSCIYLIQIPRIYII